MSNLKSQIESLLFVSPKPLSIRQLAKILKKKAKEIAQAADELKGEYTAAGRGIQIIKSGNKLQMVSSGDNAEIIQEFMKDEISGELSRPSLETLTIIAYRGPITKMDLDRIRGVNCALILRNLLLRGLITAKEDKQKKEIYYNVTLDFIRYLGVNDVTQLPDYERLHKDDTLQRILAEEKEK